MKETLFPKKPKIQAPKLGFGRHKGKTIEWVFFYDPGYPWWMLEHGAEENLSGAAQARFDDLVRRARHLRVPGTCHWCHNKPINQMRLIRHISGGLGAVEFLCGTCGHDCGFMSSLTTPSFYTPDFFRNYDKTGAEFLVRQIKYAYYGFKPPRMTQARMEDFFNNPENFINF